MSCRSAARRFTGNWRAAERPEQDQGMRATHSQTVSVTSPPAARGTAFERFTGFPHDENAIISTPDGANVAWLRDPDGNLISVVQYG